MIKAGEILKKKYEGFNIVNNDIEIKYVNDINVNRNEKYSLNRNKFKPNSQESLCAVDIAEKLNDLNNFAFYYRVVKTIGPVKSDRLLRTVLQNIKEKKETKYPVRNIRKYFVWIYKNKKY